MAHSGCEELSTRRHRQRLSRSNGEYQIDESSRPLDRPVRSFHAHYLCGWPLCFRGIRGILKIGNEMKIDLQKEIDYLEVTCLI